MQRMTKQSLHSLGAFLLCRGKCLDWKSLISTWNQKRELFPLLNFRAGFALANS